MNLRDFIVRWNNDNPLDRKFREKHNISFNSIEHRRINQFDLLMQFIEDKVFEEFKSTVEHQMQAEEEYKKGIWLREVKLSSDESQDLFDKIDIFKLNVENSQIKVK